MSCGVIMCQPSSNLSETSDEPPYFFPLLIIKFEEDCFATNVEQRNDIVHWVGGQEDRRWCQQQVLLNHCFIFIKSLETRIFALKKVLQRLFETYCCNAPLASVAIDWLVVETFLCHHRNNVNYLRFSRNAVH